MKWSTYCHEKTAPLVKGVEDGADQNPRSFLAVPILLNRYHTIQVIVRQ